MESGGLPGVRWRGQRTRTHMWLRGQAAEPTSTCTRPRWVAGTGQARTSRRTAQGGVRRDRPKPGLDRLVVPGGCRGPRLRHSDEIRSDTGGHLWGVEGVNATGRRSERHVRRVVRRQNFAWIKQERQVRTLFKRPGRSVSPQCRCGPRGRSGRGPPQRECGRPEAALRSGPLRSPAGRRTGPFA